MAVIPIMRPRSMGTSVAFYTGLLDLERADGDDDSRRSALPLDSLAAELGR